VVVNFACRLSATRATLVALGCTLSEIFDVPVYWPILVVYFFVLFALTMRRQIQCVFSSSSCSFSASFSYLARLPSSSLPPLILYSPPCTNVRAAARHMIKYKYVPFDIGRKARYGSK
jgi:hypothetical protein